MPLTDNELIALMEDSPKKARTMLVEQYRNFVFAVVMSKLRGVVGIDEMEECVNDVFMAVFGSISTYSGKGTLKSFIGTIGVRTALDRFRKAVRDKNRLSSVDEEEMPLLPAEDDTAETVEEKEFRKRLWEIVDELGEPDAKIIVYQYCYEMKVNEIASALSMKPDAVQKRSIRARKRIRKILEKENLI